MDRAAAHIELAALPTSPGWARRHAQAVLGAWQIPAETTEVALLLVSELATNAYQAAIAVGPDPGPAAITQTLRYQLGQIIIEVTDNNPRPPVIADVGPHAESGRGLLLVQALAKEWSWFIPPTGQKTVYCTLAIPEDHDPQITFSATHLTATGPPKEDAMPAEPAILSGSTSTAEEALATIAGLLCRADFNVDIPSWDRSSLLKISNTRGALCELTITTSGTATASIEPAASDWSGGTSSRLTP